MDRARFAPEFDLKLDGRAVSADLCGHIQAVRCHTGYDGVDEVELTLANDGLRWLDSPLFRLDTALSLSLGYAPDPLTQVFDGDIVAHAANFPSGAAPTFVVTAHDRRHRMAEGKKVRWFAIPLPCPGNLPVPDYVTAQIVTLENRLLPLVDVVGAALSILLTGADIFVAVTDPDSAQKIIRKQANESDYDLIARIAVENGWDLIVQHDGPAAGHVLRFTSSLDRLGTDFTFRYGRSLIDFVPRISQVGQVGSIGAFVWVPAIKTTFTVALGFDWDRMSLTLSIFPGSTLLNMQAADYMIEEPLTVGSVAHKIVGELIPRLNRRLTATGSIVGEPRLRPGNVLRIEGTGEEFGGLYRAVGVTHTLDSGGFRTSFEARKEIWFGSIPPRDQGAIPVRLSF